jgi:hypothetical protein
MATVPPAAPVIPWAPISPPATGAPASTYDLVVIVALWVVVAGVAVATRRQPARAYVVRAP